MRVGAALPAVMLFVSPLLGFEGKVVDKSGAVIVGAQVSILGHSGSVRTDSSGWFRWSPDPRLPFEILVFLPNGQYAAPQLVTEFPRNGPVLIEISPVRADGVTVSTVTPNIEVPVANAMTVLTEAELEMRQPQVLADALRDVTGVEIVSEGVGAAPAIRGLARGRTLVMMNGGRISTERRAGPSATFVNPFFLDGVEVARGPGSVAYGSDAIGGVIHLITHRPAFDEPLRFRWQGSLGFGFPSAGAGLEVTQGGGRWSYLLQGGFRQLDDYDSPVGEVTNSGARFGNFLAKTTVRAGSGRLSLAFQSDHGRDVGRPRTNADQERFFYPEEDSERFTASYEVDPFAGFSVGKFEWFLGSYRLVTRRETLAAEESGREVNDADVKAKDFGFRALLVRPLNKARWELGIDLNGRFDLSALDQTSVFNPGNTPLGFEEVISIEDAASREMAGYTSLDYLVASLLTASGGVRLSHFSSKSRGQSFGARSTSEGAVAGFASLKYQPLPELDLIGQVARGFRQPLLSDRYFEGVTARGTITGNPDLNSESSLQFDVSARYSRGPFRWAIYGYRYHIGELIERFETSPDQFTFRNRGRALVRGMEVEGFWAARRDLTLRLGFQLARGRSLDDDQCLDDIPPANLSLTLTQNILESGYLQVRAVAYRPDERPGPTEVALPGYGTLDLGSGWQLPSDLRLRLQLRNLFDKDYPLSPDRRAVLAPGRSLVILLDLEI